MYFFLCFLFSISYVHVYARALISYGIPLFARARARARLLFVFLILFIHFIFYTYYTNAYYYYTRIILVHYYFFFFFFILSISSAASVQRTHTGTHCAHAFYSYYFFFSSFVFYRYYIIRIRVHRIAHNIIINTLFCAVLVSAVPRPITAQSAYIPGIVLLYCATHR